MTHKASVTYDTSIDGFIRCYIDTSLELVARRDSVYLGVVKGSKASWKLYSYREHKEIYCRPGMSKAEVKTLMKKKVEKYIQEKE